jgi:D-alanyl-D-alanine carboxypeptidase/D-alanyl-D-alanine-endopeptidase (penicillin-binding protein 4)
MKRALFLLLLAAGATAQLSDSAAALSDTAAQALSSNAQPLADRIERLFAQSPVTRTAFWGIQVTELSTGKTLYQLNANRFFVPASNTKLFSTSLALTRLGPDFTFQTRVMTGAAPDADGRIAGDVRLVGGGDPNLSARAIPYRMGPGVAGTNMGDPLAAIARLADQVAARGIHRIDGDIVGDDSWYVWEPFGNGWSIDDPTYDYGAPVSALTVNDNAFTLSIRPGAQDGDPAAIELNPAVEYYSIDNRIRTVAASGDPHAERRIHYSRAAGSMTLKLWGAIPLGGRGEDLTLGIDDPALYAAIAFRQALEDRGITVAGGANASHLYPNEVADLKQGAPPVTGIEQDIEPAIEHGIEPGVELAARTSAPLLEDLRITAKVSQNLHAELDLRAVGRARRNLGSVEAGLDELKAFLTEAGVDPGGYNINDGSGLARLNLVSPATVVKLLGYMYASPARDNFLSILPVGGQDGTLSSRFGDPSIAGRIHAKTGSLAHVSALSGYAQRRRGDWIAFSILVNNYNGPTAEVRAVMDRICELMLE